jgi:hypothetical protein
MDSAPDCVQGNLTGWSSRHFHDRRALKIVLNAGSGLTDEWYCSFGLTIDASDAAAVPRAALRQYVIQYPPRITSWASVPNQRAGLALAVDECDAGCRTLDCTLRLATSMVDSSRTEPREDPGHRDVSFMTSG